MYLMKKLNEEFTVGTENEMKEAKSQGSILIKEVKADTKTDKLVMNSSEKEMAALQEKADELTKNLDLAKIDHDVLEKEKQEFFTQLENVRKELDTAYADKEALVTELQVLKEAKEKTADKKIKETVK